MADGLIFGIGKLEVQVGADPAIELGVLQNVSIDISTSTAQLRGGQSKYPVKVAITERTVSGSAEFAKLEPLALQVLLGGTLTADSPAVGTDTLAITSTDEPVEFKLTLSEPSDGSNVKITLNRCISTNFGMAFNFSDFMIPSFDFEAMADSSGNVMTIVAADPV